MVKCSPEGGLFMTSEMRRLRVTKCLNAATIAEKAGISRQRYMYIEVKSRIKALEEPTIRKISMAIGCGVYDLADVSQYLTVEPKSKEELDALIRKIEERYGEK